MSWDADTPDWVPTSPDVVAYTWARYRSRANDEASAPPTVPPSSSYAPPSTTSYPMTSAPASMLPPRRRASESVYHPHQAYSTPYPSPPLRLARAGSASSVPQTMPTSLPLSSPHQALGSSTPSIASLLPQIRQRVTTQPLSSIAQMLASMMASWAPSTRGELVANLTETWSVEQAALLVAALVPFQVHPVPSPSSATVFFSPTASSSTTANQPGSPELEYLDSFARATTPARLNLVLAQIPETAPLPIFPSGPLNEPFSPSGAASAGRTRLGVELRLRLRQISEAAHPGALLDGGSRLH